MSTNQCPTRSGRFQCEKAQGHAGECHTHDKPRPMLLGPYRDSVRARAYLRGRLDSASGNDLDVIGRAFGLPRAHAEDDSAYRVRVWGAAQ